MILVFLIICFLKVIHCINFNDGDIYNITLKGSKPTPENSEVFSSQNILYSNSTVTVSITDISPSLGFLITQSHSYKYNLTLSYERNLDLRYHTNGTNIGLVIEKSSSKLFYITNYGFNNVSFYLSIHAYFKNAPVPGGCNMEFNIIDAPFMKLWHDNNMIRVDASQARVSIDGNCDVGSTNVTHEFYKMYLPEWDHTEKEYFDSLKKMLTVGNITKHGSHVPGISAYALLRRYFSLYAGTGTFYVIIAKNNIMSAAYVPIHTYGCDDCGASWLDILYLVLITTVGVLLNFFGFTLHMFQYHIFGIILVMLCTYTLIHFITNSFLAISVFYGISFLIFEIFSRIGEGCNMNFPAMLILGFQIACIFYQIIPDGILANEYYFWLILIGVTLTVTFLPLFEFGYNIACAVIGSFCLTILIDSLAGSYLRYIVINVLRRITVANFNIAITDPPYQWRDIVVSIVWIAIVLVDCILYICIFRKINNTAYDSAITTYGTIGRTPRESREPRFPRMPRFPRIPRIPRIPRTPREPRMPRK